MTSLYRCYDAEERLLYVGISRAELVRLQQHASSGHWVTRMARMEIERFPSRAAAAKAEIAAIRAESPLHNVRHTNNPKPRPKRDPDRCTAWDEAKRATHPPIEPFLHHRRMAERFGEDYLQDIVGPVRWGRWERARRASG